MIKPEPYVDGEVGHLPMFDLSGEVRCWALVDKEDFPEISRYRWHLGGGGHAVRNAILDGRQVTVLMQRQILGLPYDGAPRVIHLGDPLDNRRSQLSISRRWLLKALDAQPGLDHTLLRFAQIAPPLQPTGRAA